jgi:hypothetical protein
MLKFVRINSEAGDFHAIVSTEVNPDYFKGREGAPCVSDADVVKELAEVLPHESSVCCKQLVEVATAFSSLTAPASTAEVDTLWKKLKRRETILLNKPLSRGRIAAHVLFCSPDGVSVVDSFWGSKYEANIREGFEYLLYRVEGFSDGSDLDVDTWRVEDRDPGCNAYAVSVSHPALDCSYHLNIVALELK